jgi:Phage tail tube protein
MAFSTGVNKRVAYKREPSWGVLPGATTAKVLRRVTAAFNLTKEVYSSAEIRSDYQTAVFNHGVRSADGSLNGELSPGTYADFMGSLLAKDFVAGAALTGLGLTIATSGSLFTVTRAAGSFITDNIKVGDVVRITAGSVNAANLNNNLLVVAVTALALTVRVLSTTTLVAEGPIASCALTVIGKKTEVPLTGHTDQSYSVEEWYSDIAQSQVFTGMKLSAMNVSMPATGFSTVDFTFMGKDLGSTGTSAYYTSPTAAGTTGVVAGVNGAVVVNGVPVAVITDASFSVTRQVEGATVLGSNSQANMFTGTIGATGNMSVYFENTTFRDYFKDEAEVSVVFALTTTGDKAADAISFTMPRVKLGSFTVADGSMGLTASCDFTALLNSNTAAGLPATTVAVQDTAA